ncbi:DUF305 domain-containing protein [Skermania sp. ID1734]|uniref:DUF305 domain-containing protein n=1 Tax=Skermania sp. ID1734 TaxID=2597516 RepID=UPI00117EA143|nr:DUF305 domain-containing protein [Skermania sp. ID1734]TSD93803.1 DUF305 domain-containing protein [Skermania sp. ID1734]
MFLTRAKSLAVMGAAAVTALTLAGCGNNSDNATTPTSMPSMSMPGMSHASTGSSAPPQAQRTDYNDADVTFLEMMYPHHAQAIEMAKLVPSRSQNQQIKDLAANIEKAQGPEMQQFASLLRSFGKPAPTTGMGDMGGQMNGMMNPDQMKALQAASGAEFDKMFLTMMIEHHKGAIDMANTELANGVNADVKKLAASIVSDQQAEITQMQKLLAG